MKYSKKYFKYIPILLLVLTVLIIGYFVYFSDFNNKYLKVVFLDVGQGDAIFIESPNGKQMLIDGGPENGNIIPKLNMIMPLGDRSIDLILATHPDSDHIGGLPKVLDNFKVDFVIENDFYSDTKIYKEFKDEIIKNKINKITASSGMKIVLDEKNNIYFDILFPFEDFVSKDSNDNSIVGKLVYNNNSFMMTGDAPVYSELLLHQKYGTFLKSDVLKLGHHGSTTSSSVLFLEDINPSLVIISAGKNNRYGHPSQDILDRLVNMKIPYLTTIDMGNIIIKTDGNNLIY